MYVTLKEYAELHGISYGYIGSMMSLCKWKADFKKKGIWYVDPEKPWIETKYRKVKTNIDVSKEDKRHLTSIFYGMKYRCYNSNSENYYLYGGRGIKVCDEWKDNISAFIEWAILNGYKIGLTIDRIDSDGNYEPSNCQWISRSENAKKAAKPNTYCSEHTCPCFSRACTKSFYKNCDIRKTNRRIRNITKFVKEYPDTLDSFKKKFPDLPWNEMQLDCIKS